MKYLATLERRFVETRSCIEALPVVIEAASIEEARAALVLAADEGELEDLSSTDAFPNRDWQEVHDHIIESETYETTVAGIEMTEDPAHEVDINAANFPPEEQS